MCPVEVRLFHVIVFVVVVVVVVVVGSAGVLPSF